MELGQALVHAGIGEGFAPSAVEVDLDAAEEAYGRAETLAQELGETATLAAVIGEIAVIENGRVRAWFVERIRTGEVAAVMERVAGGELLEDVLAELPIAPLAHSARERLHRALALFEELGDRQGIVASIVAMAYVSWAPDIHIGADSARHIEEIRRLASAGLVHQREPARVRGAADALRGARLRPGEGDTASRSPAARRPTSRHARSATVSWSSSPRAGPRSRTWRWGTSTPRTSGWSAQRGPRPRAPPRSGRSSRSARPAQRGPGRREQDAWPPGAGRAARDRAGPTGGPMRGTVDLALAAASVGRAQGDEQLLALAERTAADAKALLPLLPGHAPWGRGRRRARDGRARARAAGRRRRGGPIRGRRPGRGDARRSNLDVLLPVAEAVASAGTDEERAGVLGYLGLQAAVIAEPDRG